jgi:hypothetical protein
MEHHSQTGSEDVPDLCCIGGSSAGHQKGGVLGTDTGSEQASSKNLGTRGKLSNRRSGTIGCIIGVSTKIGPPSKLTKSCISPSKRGGWTRFLGRPVLLLPPSLHKPEGRTNLPSSVGWYRPFGKNHFGEQRTRSPFRDPIAKDDEI